MKLPPALLRDVRYSWLVRMGGAAAAEAREAPAADYETVFRGVWRERFWWLPERDRAAAVEGQWRRYRAERAARDARRQRRRGPRR